MHTRDDKNIFNKEIIGIVFIIIISDFISFDYIGSVSIIIVISIIKYIILFSYLFFLKSKINLKYKSIIAAYNREVYIDGLTKSKNRKFLDLTLKNKMDKIKLTNQGNMGIIMLDIDNFKYINDFYGHLCGDKVLIEVVTIIKNIIRNSDEICRFGGDEFIVTTSDIQKFYLNYVCKRITTLFENCNLTCNNSIIKIDISLGQVHIDRYMDVDTIFGLVDKELYKAKNNKMSNNITVRKKNNIE
ncbi:MAG: GGDEF domain-containing protein [Ignavibacteriaceae bacterium]